MNRSTVRLVGEPRQPQHDSYGRKVPIWEAVAVEQQERGEDKEQQSFWNPRSWKNASSVASSQSTQIGIPYGGKSLKEASWVSWFSRLTSWKGFKSTEKDDQTSSSGQLSTSWKPASLKLPVLGGVFVVTLVLIAGLELLSQISMNSGNGGGLVFAKTVEDIPMGYAFVYLYLPTVIAVIYSMTWSWIDLDTKRLEPWFQLSKPEGATAEHSILLQYPFEFLALVPIKAARRRHWAVVIAGATMVFITWAIVPLQSAIFSTGIVSRTTQTQMAIIGSMIAPQAQTQKLNVNFMNRAYGVAWLDQKLPPFTTKEYSLIPFVALNERAGLFEDATWTTITQMYYTNLTCKPAKFEREPPLHSWKFESEDGCLVRQMNLQAPSGNGTDYIIHYIQYFDDAQVARALQNPNCTREHSNKFLAIWGERTNYTEPDDGNQYSEWSNLTALFCEAEYYRRNVSATVAASDKAVVSIDYGSLSDAELVGEDIFNASHLHYTMGTGVTSTPTVDDLPNINVLEQYPRIVKSGLQWPISAMSGFGIAVSDQNLASFSDPVVIHSTFQKAHQLLFSMAMSFAIETKATKEPSDVTLQMTKATEDPLAATLVAMQATEETSAATVVQIGQFHDKPGSIILERTFAIIVEVSLGLVALLTVALWIYYHRRPSNMVSDPASVSDIMKLVRTSRKLLHDFNDNGTVTAEVLNERLKSQRFRLRASMAGGFPHMKLEAAGADSGFDEEKRQSFERSQNIIDCPEQYKSIRPLEMKVFTGALLGVVVAGAIATVTVLYANVTRFDGKHLPVGRQYTDNGQHNLTGKFLSFILLILENLVPTAFATFIEPFWVVLNRLLCILQPFEDLRNGNAKSESTVHAKYTAVPPQLALWRALKSEHSVLALVCLVAMSNNLLAVALSGLFEESPTRVLIPTLVTSQLSPAFNGTPKIRPGYPGSEDIFIITYLDHYYTTLSNATVNGGAPLPAWVDNQYFYMPFDLPDLNLSNGKVRGMELEAYELRTRGLGLEVDCKEVFMAPPPGSLDTIVFRTAQNGSNIMLYMNHTEPNGDVVSCWPSNVVGMSDQIYRPKAYGHEAQAIEFMSSMIRSGEVEGALSDSYCNNLLLAGWVHAPAQNPEDFRQSAPRREDVRSQNYSSSFMTCQPQFRTAMFDIRVDRSGRVLSANQSSEFETDFSQIAPPESIQSVLQQSTEHASPTNSKSTVWHNNTMAFDWMNSLLKAHLNSSELLNPSAPAPNITTLIPVMKDMFQRLFPVVLLGNLDLFSTAPVPIQAPATIIAHETRIFMSPIMFYLTVSLLGLQLLVAFAYYAYRPRRFLPRMPLTIASVIAYVSASHAVHDTDSNGLGSEKNDIRYGYGRFIGVDGRSHVGIEKAPLVVPLKIDNPDFKRRRRSRLLMRKQDPAMPKIWI